MEDNNINQSDNSNNVPYGILNTSENAAMEMLFTLYRPLMNNINNPLYPSSFNRRIIQSPPTWESLNQNNLDIDWSNFLENLLVSPNMRRDNPSSFIEQLLQRTLLSSKKTYKNVLSKEGKEQIEIVKYTTEDFKDQKCCPISQKKFEIGEAVAYLPCGHIFDQVNILKWLENEKANCPVCRFKLKSIEKKNTEPEQNEDVSENEINPPDHLNALNELMNNISFINHPSVVNSITPPISIQSRRNRRLSRILERAEEMQEERDLQEALIQSIEEMNYVEEGMTGTTTQDVNDEDEIIIDALIDSENDDL